MSVLDKLKLDGKVAVVTGAGRGLGRAMAIALAEAGCDIVAAARTRSQIEETAELVRTKGRRPDGRPSGRCLPVPTDITDPASVLAMVDAAIAEFGRIDILLNNAGGATEGMGKPVEQVTDEEWRTGIDTNLSGTFYCCRAAIHQPSCGQSATVTALADGVARSRADLHSVPVKARLLGGNSRLL